MPWHGSRIGPVTERFPRVDEFGNFDPDPRELEAMEAEAEARELAERESVRRVMFNQGCPLSAAEIHGGVHQGSHGVRSSLADTQATLDAMEAEGQAKRVGSERWGYSYWLVPLKGFDR